MRIVIKVGTNLLTKKDGSLNTERIELLAAEMAELKKDGCQIVLVSSGAIGAGMGKLGLTKRPTGLREKQALAAIGQPLLMDAYQTSFSKRQLTIAQLLLTRQDFIDRQRYLNARNTLLALLDLGVIPIINENDTVAVEEIDLIFGDNDTLSALVAAKVAADKLFIFTDVDGLYKGIPGKSEMISNVEKVTAEIEAYASPTSGSGKGVGGMKTKLNAAKIATAAGVTMIIANGDKSGTIKRILKGERIGTTFMPQKALEPRKCWIAFGATCKGKIFVDAGAAAALLERGKSLLPSGIRAVEGKFKAGDTVSILSPERKEIARGLSYFSIAELEKIKGKKTTDIKKILPYADFEEAIHRDNLVIL